MAADNENDLAFEPTNAQKIQALPWSIAHNAALTVFAQLVVFGSGFVLFLNELGLTKSQIGFLLALFPFFGLVALFAAQTVARIGYKRIFLIFWGARYFVAALLLLTPWVLSQFGPQAVLIFLTSIIIIFALCRAVGLTGLVPWKQEYIPDAIKGKYFATNNIVTSLTGFLAVSAAGFVIGQSDNINRFLLLFAIGIVFGLISIWAATFIPGGAPKRRANGTKSPRLDFSTGFKDRRFLLFNIGSGLLMLSSGPLKSFIPLFMQEQVGLNPGNVVLLQIGTLLGGLLSSYFWGWAADRYGSKPVMLSGAYFSTILPILWLIMPRTVNWSLYIALAIALFQGIANQSWIIGSTRFYFVGITPPEKRTEYSAIHTAWMGVISGTSLLVGGRLLDFTSGLSGKFLVFTLDPYTYLFIGGFIVSLASVLFLLSVQADSRVTMGEFASLFLHGNPFAAFESLIRHHFARDELAAVSTTERLGQTKSPLTIEELIEALADPRFNIRFEAIISIARRGPDPRLIEALTEVLRGSEPALSVISAWALGRLGDERAVEPLRNGLDAHYRSVQMHSARSLGTLGDTAAIPILLDRLAKEKDPGLQIAYASALGKLEVEDATRTLLKILRTHTDPSSRMEIAMALARIVGEEHHFIKLMRDTRTEMGTASSQAITSFLKKVDKDNTNFADLKEALADCAQFLALEDLQHGAGLISQSIRLLPKDRFNQASNAILQECADRLDQLVEKNPEYILLALHTMTIGWRANSSN
jgi:MFS family permease